MPVIDVLKKQGALGGIICRVNTGFSWPATRGAIWLPVHYALRVMERTIAGFESRPVEEYMMDRFAAKRIAADPSDMVIFHPEFPFPKTFAAAKQAVKTTVAIVTMAALDLSAELERTEQERLNLPNDDRYYQNSAAASKFIFKFDYLIAISDFVRDTYIARGYPADRIFVAYSDIAPIAMDSAPKPGAFRVMYASHTNMLKGLHYLLDAWQQLDIPNKELIIAGGYKTEPRALYESWKSRIAADPTIRDIGFISQAELGNWFAQSSAFVCPSLTEAIPRVVLEAMSAGLPIVTTDHARGMVQDGVSGFIVPIRDTATIAQKIRYLFDHPDQARTMGAKARETFLAKRPFGEAIYEIYETIRKRENR